MGRGQTLLASGALPSPSGGWRAYHRAPQPRDDEWCAARATALTGMGVDVWYDVSGLHGGADWPLMIEREIEAREILVALLTPKAWSSDWVQRELRLAMALKGRTIVPIILSPTEVSGFIRTIKWVDAKGKQDAADLVATHLIARGK